MREKTDYLIVLYHGGKEHYRYPSPYLQKVCRKIAEKGADLVICQHTHCIGCEEKINNSTIVYGQGNFLFDDCDNEYWLTSLLVEVELGSEACVRYIPLCKNGSSVRLAQGEEKEKILSDFFSRSEQIKREGFIEERYNAFADEMIENYLAAFQGKKLKRFIFRAINKLSGYRFAKKVLKRAYGKKELLAVENFINCEAHRELVLKGIQGRI